LAEGADGEASRARIELDATEPKALVGLGVRPQGDASAGEGVAEAPGVALDDVEIDHDGGGVEPARQAWRNQLHANGLLRGCCQRVGRSTIGVTRVPIRSMASRTSSPGSSQRPS